MINVLRKAIKKVGGKHDGLEDQIPQLIDHLINMNSGNLLVWLQCAAMARGIQWTVVDDDNGILVTPKPYKGQKRSKINKIGSWQRHMMARIVTVRPQFEVTARTSVEQQMNAASVGTAFLQALCSSKRQGWNKKRHKIGKYCTTFGNAIVYVRDYTDPLQLVPVPKVDPISEEIVIDPDTGRQAVEFKELEDIDIQVLLPHNVLCDQNPNELEDKPEVVLAFLRDLDYFPRKYGKKGEKVEAEIFGKGGNAYDLVTLSDHWQHFKDVECATEYVYLRKPSRDDPNGRVAIFGGDKLLETFEWPYKRMTKYNLVHFRWGEAEPGEFWTQSPVKDQIPIQKDMNECASIIQENIVNMGHLKWINPIGSGVKSIDDLSGEIIDCLPGYEPHQVQVLPLPHYEVNHINVLDKFMEDVQNHHSVSRGTGTPNVRSRVGLDKLAEEDQSPLGITDEFFREAYAELGWKILVIASETFDQDRMLKYTKGGRKRSIENFNRKMLDWNCDVEVRMVDEYLRNKGAAQQLILELVHNNLLVDPNTGIPDQAKVQRMLFFALPDIEKNKIEIQRDIQYDENDRLVRGEAIMPRPWEYHFEHLDVLEELLNSQEYKTIAREQPEIEQVVMQHWEGHKQLLASALNNMLAQKGGNPPEGQV